MRLYWNTLRHLRPDQLWFQLWHRLPAPRPDNRPPPERRSASGVWHVSARRAPSLRSATDMFFLDQAANLDQVGWSGDEMPLLWRYNQHYFDDIAADGAASRRILHTSLIARWIAEHPPGAQPGWDPYPTSLRLVNWSRWLLLGEAPVDGMLASMATQTRLLARRLEKHILGNHLIANAKALCFMGAQFAGQEAKGWLATGLRVLRRELAEQLLADGGNFERSPMYHALCLEDLLDLVNLAGTYPDQFAAADTAAWRKRASWARFWLEAMCHPDGEIAQFNDAAIGIAPPVAELLDYANRLAVGSVAGPGVERPAPEVIWLRDSGYVRATAGPATLFCDIAPLGPDYLPAHGHADTLSFELSIGRQRTIVNGGTSRYGSCAVRHEERSTRSHSTVTVADTNSSEVWGGFRVARRAYPFDFCVLPYMSGAVIAASHDGYRRLPDSPVHRRTWTLSEDALLVEDTVTPPAAAEARFILAPELPVDPAGTGTFACGASLVRVLAGEPEVKPGWHSRRFGRREETTTVIARLSQGRSAVRIEWKV